VYANRNVSGKSTYVMESGLASRPCSAETVDDDVSDVEKTAYDQKHKRPHDDHDGDDDDDDEARAQSVNQ